MNSIFFPSGSRQAREGIRKAKEYTEDKNNVVILLSFESEESLRLKDPDFGGLMSLSNVGFASIIGLDGIFREYKRISSGEKKEDTTGVAIYKLELLERTISILRHDVSYALADPAKLQAWLERARAADIIGSDDEIVQYVKNWTPQTYGAFEGKELEGIFVDALDTLFYPDWTLNAGIKAVVEKMSEEIGKPITVISDSDKWDVESALKKGKITWKYISKFTLRGATLETVVDNLSKEEFEKTYSISAKHFISVSELL